MHDDRMGTSNVLAQFAGKNFIELLEVDRPDRLLRHDFAISPPFFSFGEHNRQAVRARDGLSMMVFKGDDARGDISSFAAAELGTFAPFDFERIARMPDGTEATLAFSLAFVQSPDMPRVAFLVCENRARRHFWKPQYQAHVNGATGIAAVYLSSPDPQRDAGFVSKMFGDKVRPMSGGCSVACGPAQELRVLTPQATAALDGAVDAKGPGLAGVAIVAEHRQGLTRPEAACGMFIEWISPAAEG
jgi:hypothetical protein